MPQQPTFLPFFHFNNFLLHFSKTKQIEIWLKQHTTLLFVFLESARSSKNKPS